MGLDKKERKHEGKGKVKDKEGKDGEKEDEEKRDEKEGKGKVLHFLEGKKGKKETGKIKVGNLEKVLKEREDFGENRFPSNDGALEHDS